MIHTRYSIRVMIRTHVTWNNLNTGVYRIFIALRTANAFFELEFVFNFYPDHLSISTDKSCINFVNKFYWYKLVQLLQKDYNFLNGLKNKFVKNSLSKKTVQLTFFAKKKNNKNKTFT